VLDGLSEKLDLAYNSVLTTIRVLEKKGYLRATEARSGKSWRKVYRATPVGRKALRAAKAKVRELFGELIEGRT